MQLFATSLELHSNFYDVTTKVGSCDYRDVLRAVYNNFGLSPEAVIDLIISGNYQIVEKDIITQAIRDLFDIVGNDWVRDKKISAIRLVRKFTKYALLDAKNLIEGNLE
jgi:ribosomal protein L7/L12